MSSRQKRKQARQDGAKTAGPKSPVPMVQTAARTFSSSSLAGTLVLANESKTKFDELFQSYVCRFQPKDEVEMGFINEMVAARWRQQRMWMIQTAGTDLEMYRMQEQIQETMFECPESMRISIAFTHMANKEKTAELVTRCETTYSRMHDRAMKALQRLQQMTPPSSEEQLQNAAPNVVPEAAESIPEPAVDPEIPTTSNSPDPQKQKLRHDAKPHLLPPAVETSGPPDHPSPEPDLL